jgi:hypothetical protein
MNIYDEKVFKLKEGYNKEYFAILNNSDLTKTGKDKALTELNNRALNEYSSIRQQLKGHLHDHDASKAALMAQDTRERLTGEEIEQERRQGDLILSRLSAISKPIEFEAAAKELAEKNPAAFELVFKEVVKMARGITPKESVQQDPWSGDVKEVDSAEAARLQGELSAIFDTARAANIGPGEIERQEKIEAVRDSMSNLQSTLSLIDRFEKSIKQPSPWPTEVAEG